MLRRRLRAAAREKDRKAIVCVTVECRTYQQPDSAVTVVRLAGCRIWTCLWFGGVAAGIELGKLRSGRKEGKGLGRARGSHGRK